MLIKEVLLVFIALLINNNVFAKSVIQRPFYANNDLVCFPGESFRVECNSCVCKYDGSSFVCTMRACPPSTDPVVEQCKYGDVVKIDQKICKCNDEGYYDCKSYSDSSDTNDVNEPSSNDINTDSQKFIDYIRKKRQADYYDQNTDYLYEDPIPESYEQRRELERQKYMQRKQDQVDRRREQQELAQQQAELTQQRAEMQQQLEYQRQLDEEQQAIDAQQWESDLRADYYDQELQQQQAKYYQKQYVPKKY